MPAEAIDSMHVYYHQGVASWEIGLVWSAMQAAAPNLSLKTLAETAVSSGWVCPGWHKASRQLPARLLHEKLFDEEGYKGQAEQASPLIPLLRYYLHELFAPRGLLRAQRASFDCLAEIHGQMRRLRYLQRPVVAEDVQQLQELEGRHQKLFIEAYTEAYCKPKHHHRFHLAQSCLLLGMLPACEVHEKKHTIYKSTLCDRFEGRVCEPKRFARLCLANMLQDTIRQLKTFGVSRWELDGQREAAAPKLRAALRCPSLQTASIAVLWKHRFSAGDLLVFSDSLAGMLRECLSDGSNIWLLADKLQLLSRHTWGHRWKRAGESLLWKVTTEEEVSLPQWWHPEDDVLLSLR